VPPREKKKRKIPFLFPEPKGPGSPVLGATMGLVARIFITKYHTIVA
jgi:hypothetical protein